MAKIVIKKGGKIEKFQPEKIKKALTLAIEPLNLSLEEKSQMVEKILNEVMEFVKGKKEIATVEIEAKILLELDKILPEAAKNWREYRIKKKKQIQ